MRTDDCNELRYSDKPREVYRRICNEKRKCRNSFNGPVTIVNNYGQLQSWMEQSTFQSNFF